MFEEFVSFLLVKLDDPVFREAASSCKVNDNVQLLWDELSQLLKFLGELEKNARARYDKSLLEKDDFELLWGIEDAIDIFLVDFDTLSQKSSRLQRKIEFEIETVRKKFVSEIKYLFGKIEIITRKFRVRRKLGLVNVQKDTKLLGEGPGTGVSVRVKRPTLTGVEETKLLAIRDDDKKEIIRLLLDKNFRRRYVVSIEGDAGAGKTTLAQIAFSSDDIKNQFDVCLFFMLDDMFSHTSDLLKEMLQKIRFIEDHEWEQGNNYFREEIYKSLLSKKYLVVLDNVDQYFLRNIEDVFPGVKNGSRVLITSISRYTYQRRVELADVTYRLRKLDESESLDLLLKTALPNGASNRSSDLEDIAKKLAGRCDGLPLYLVVLGGLLSVKRQERYVWRGVLETLDSIGLFQRVLATSYEDMPVDLKICFNYLAVFPRNRAIDARVLIRLWIAEGFIRKKSGELPEDTAQCYLEELIQRKMVIVLRTSYDSSVRSILVHEIIHKFVIKKAGNILISVNSDVGPKYHWRSPRRLPVSNISDYERIHELMSGEHLNIRSFYCFNVDDIPTFNSHKLLKVVNLEGSINCRGGGMMFERSNHLRFLRLTTEKQGFSSILGHLISRLCEGQLNYLETLDLRTSAALKGTFPEDFWRIRTLRHVILPKNWEVPGPPLLAELENLQTLKYVKFSDSWLPTKLPIILNVSILKLQVRFGPSITSDEQESIKSDEQETIAELLKTLKNLIALHLDLDIVSPTVTLHIAAMQAFPFYHCLKNLTLVGIWDVRLGNATLPPNLIKLQLFCSCLEEDLMPELGKLSQLKILTLFDAYKGKKMICPAGGFPILEYLELVDFENLEELVIEEGAMGNLKLLKIVCCDELKPLPEHLTCRIEWDIY